MFGGKLPTKKLNNLFGNDHFVFICLFKNKKICQWAKNQYFNFSFKEKLQSNYHFTITFFMDNKENTI